MTDQDNSVARTRSLRLSRRALLGALVFAPALPWLVQAAHARGGGNGDGGDDGDDPAHKVPLSSTMPLPRQQHTATPLGGGYILLVGGLNQEALADVEILGPDGRLYAAAPLNTPRYAHAAVRIGGGQVVVLGGFGQGPLADVELYDPDRNTWTLLPPLSLPRYAHAAAHVSDGNILLTGGAFQSILSETELYAL